MIQSVSEQTRGQTSSLHRCDCFLWKQTHVSQLSVPKVKFCTDKEKAE